MIRKRRKGEREGEAGDSYKEHKKEEWNEVKMKEIFTAVKKGQIKKRTREYFKNLFKLVGKLTRQSKRFHIPKPVRLIA